MGVGIFARFLLRGIATQGAKGGAKQLSKLALNPKQFFSSFKKTGSVSIKGLSKKVPVFEYGPEKTFGQAAKEVGAAAYKKAAPFALETVAVAGATALAVKASEQLGGETIEGNAQEIKNLQKTIDENSKSMKEQEELVEKNTQVLKDANKVVTQANKKADEATKRAEDAEDEVAQAEDKIEGLEEELKELKVKTDADFEALDKRLDQLGG